MVWACIALAPASLRGSTCRHRRRIRRLSRLDLPNPWSTTPPGYGATSRALRHHFLKRIRTERPAGFHCLRQLAGKQFAFALLIPSPVFRLAIKRRIAKFPEKNMVYQRGVGCNADMMPPARPRVGPWLNRQLRPDRQSFDMLTTGQQVRLGLQHDRLEPALP